MLLEELELKKSIILLKLCTANPYSEIKSNICGGGELLRKNENVINTSFLMSDNPESSIIKQASQRF